MREDVRPRSVGKGPPGLLSLLFNRRLGRSCRRCRRLLLRAGLRDGGPAQDGVQFGVVQKIKRTPLVLQNASLLRLGWFARPRPGNRTVVQPRLIGTATAVAASRAAIWIDTPPAHRVTPLTRTCSVWNADHLRRRRHDCRIAAAAAIGASR